MNIKESLVSVDIDHLITSGLEELGEQNAILLYPVNKDRRLPDAFPDETAPVPLTMTESAIAIATMIVEPLGALLEEARTAGFSPYLTSGFRSVHKQQDVFAYWTKQEMRPGLTQENAAIIANAYSAKPGYSEHHLGTTVDILASQDKQEWDRARENFNVELYGWMRDNAHLYGFALSYPTGPGNIQYAKSGSGYPSAEPWHLRFVGRTIAGYLYGQHYLNPQIPVTLNSFLENLFQFKNVSSL
jgi:LAS superfamily LD-carboxypeptidase LdcB